MKEEREEDNEEENELGCGQNVKKIGEKGDSGVENVNVESEKDTLEKGTEPGTVKDGAGPKRKHSDVLVNGNEFVADCPNPAKKESKARLPLPSALFTSTSSSSTSSSPSSSSTSSSRGRVRSFAHVRGNWASHVFLKPFVNDESMGELSQKISEEAMKVFEQNSLPKVEVRLGGEFILKGSASSFAVTSTGVNRNTALEPSTETKCLSRCPNSPSQSRSIPVDGK